MINTQEFEKFKKQYSSDWINYPQNFTHKNIVIEFLQIKVMEFISQKEYWKQMILIGGSSLRHLRNWVRTTSDLDYDSIWIDQKYFQKICFDIKKFLEDIWCNVIFEINVDSKDEDDIYNCSFFIWTWYNEYNDNSILDWEINIRLKIDLKDSDWNYPTEWVLPSKSINNIAIYTAVISSLLSKKICWFLSRPHRASVAKDLIDIVFLLQETAPDYDYLYRYEEISNKEQLINRLELKYNRITEEELNYSLLKMKKNLINLDYSDVPYNAIQIIKDQLSYY